MSAQPYWRATRLLTVILLLLWIGITFVVSAYADELNAYSWLGFPLGFYMSAQGALLLYLLLIGIYCWAMNRLDARYGIDQS